MESIRLALLSDLALSAGPAYHLGRHMLFHHQTTAVGIFRQRLHGERGQAVTNGMSDFRGVAAGGAALAADDRPLGGVVEFGTSSEPIASGQAGTDALLLAAAINSSVNLKQLLVESPFHAHLGAMIMQAEDAPQPTNRVDLDPDVRDVFGLPVVRLTYSNSKVFELDAAAYYKPLMIDVLGKAGAQFGFVDPTGADVPPRSRHVMGGLRMGSDPAESVCNAYGRFHDVDNLYCMDGGVFVTSSGYNPTLTIIALALRAAANMTGASAGSLVADRRG
jgi:choline dehydrogenase-like flavoprotein